jgi:hypothetical protein
LSPAQTLFSSSDTAKILIALVTVFAAPLIRSLISDYREKSAFKVFLKAHTKNAKDSFGKEHSIKFVRESLSLKGEWIDTLEMYGLGVPEILIGIQETISKALLPESCSSGYWPYITYLGVKNESTPIEPESIIWKLKKEETRAAANYFISQEQVLSSLRTQYEEPYFELIKNGNLEQRVQWCQRLESSLIDLSEHYVNLVKLRTVIQKG